MDGSSTDTPSSSMPPSVTGHDQETANFVPHVVIGVIPKVGQEFHSPQEAQEFYNNYARQAGFSTRVDNSKKNRETGEVIWKLFVCSKEGQTDETWQQKLKNNVPRSGQRKRGHTRCGCEARMSIVKSKSKDMWIVSHFIEKHSHVLTTPSKVHLLKSHRKVSTAKKALVQQLTDANIPTCQQVRLLEINAGGPSSVGCLEKDIRNHERDIRSELFGHDAETLIQHFEMEKERNSNFYFSYETDDNDVFLRCFWADCASRSSYAHFGDVVVFDTTYNTNKYGMVFAPFVGVNHHRQTTFFGCGLLSGEKAESFIWLFQEFLEAMPNHAFPKVIITDQDAAIARAVSVVFPDILHRFCLWHILNKFSEKLNVFLYKEQYHKLANIIKESESPEEFEDQWKTLMSTTELRKNEWLNSMYEIRHRWVPAYVRHVFAAGMSSSQRVESNHSFFKRYVNHKNSLTDFITRFNRALVNQRHLELEANHIDLSQEPRLVTGCLMEQQMATIYTKKIFLLFQKELQGSMFYISKMISNTNDTSIYVVKRFDTGKTFHRQRELTHHTSSDLLSCSCHTFQFEGYSCRHMLCWMKVQQVMLLPHKYINQRWTKNARVATIYEPMRDSVKDQSFISRRGLLAHVAMKLVDDCSLTEARSNFLMKELSKLKRKVNDIDGDSNIGTQANKSKNHDRIENVQDPHQIKSKGKRLKSSKDKAMSQSNRTCSVCGQGGHDKRTCPDVVHYRSQSVDEMNCLGPSLPNIQDYEIID